MDDTACMTANAPGIPEDQVYYSTHDVAHINFYY